MWPMDSSLDESMNEQVLTMTTSAFSASGITRIPAWCRWPIMISESTRFLAQPSEMRLTVSMKWGRRGRKGGNEKPRHAAAVSVHAKVAQGVLFLGGGGEFGAGLLALEIGGAAFAFDD